MNKITLVRLDGDAKHEVDIPVGETVIGRGPVMQCTDKRVSRTHAQIKVSEDGKIELTSTSLNPCYYNDDKVIKKSSSVELSIGDRFSFLPDSYCYCVKAGPLNGSATGEGACSSDVISKIDGTEEKPFSTEENCVQSVNPDAVCAITVTPAADDGGGEVSTLLVSVASTTDLSGEMTDPDVPSDGEKNGPTDTSLRSAIKHLPNWLLAAMEQSKRSGEEPSSGELGTEKVKTAIVVHGAETLEEKCPARDSDGSSGRGRKVAKVAASASAVHQMSDDSESEEVVGEKLLEEAAGLRQSPLSGELGTEKVKTAIVVHGAETLEEKCPARDSDGSSGRGRKVVKVAASASAVHQMSDDSESEEVVGEKLLEEAAGLRQSPTRPVAASEQASEDTEENKQNGEGEAAAATADSGRSRSPVSTSSRDSCKYGSGCYRKNPQHLAEFSHPGDHDYKQDDRPECPFGTDCYRKNPLHKQNYQHTKKPEKPPKKRQRVKKPGSKDAEENSDEDDYDYDDPFLNDASSDDYEPTDSGSDVSASEGEEEEDTKRTKKEAQRFVRGKRKH